MKKLLAFVLILSCLVSTAFFKNDKNLLLEIESLTKICFVSDKKYGDEGFECVQCGDWFFNNCDKKYVKDYYEKYKNQAKAIQYYFKSEGEDEAKKLFDEIKKNLHFEVVNEQNIEEMTIYNGYSPIFGGSVYAKNKKTNVQIALKNDGEMIVGNPIILSGY